MAAASQEQGVENRTRKRAQKTRRRLKKAALDIFSEKPADSVTVEEITQKADVGKGTLYQHFADKDEVLRVLVDEAAASLIERIRSCRPGPQSLEDVLERLLEAHHEFSMDSRRQFILLFQGKLLAKLRAEPLENIERPYLRYLEEIEKQVWPYLPRDMSRVEIRRLACAVAGFAFGFFSFAVIGMTPGQLKTSIQPLRRVFARTLCESLGC